jgi:hypothetical protein
VWEKALFQGGGKPRPYYTRYVEYSRGIPLRVPNRRQVKRRKDEFREKRGRQSDAHVR